MSLSIVQVVFMLFISISFSKPNVVIAHAPNWLNETCNTSNVKHVIHPDFCLKILQSQEKIISSRNEIDLSIAIIESGISNATNTQVYIKNMLKKENLDPIMKGVLTKCNSAYKLAIGSMRGALSEVKNGDYMASSYDLKIASTDQINMCKNVVASNRINDATILIGNKVLSMFGLIAFNVINDLDNRQPQPPKMN